MLSHDFTSKSQSNLNNQQFLSINQDSKKPKAFNRSKLNAKLQKIIDSKKTNLLQSIDNQNYDNQMISETSSVSHLHLRKKRIVENKFFMDKGFLPPLQSK